MDKFLVTFDIKYNHEELELTLVRFDPSILIMEYTLGAAKVQTKLSRIQLLALKVVDKVEVI